MNKNEYTKCLPSLTELEKVQTYIDAKFAGQNVELKNTLFIIVDELFSNAVNYSGCTYVNVLVESLGDTARLTMEYDGVEFDVTKSAKPNVDLPLAERGIGGLGLYLVSQMSSKFDYVRKGGANIVIVECVKTKQ